MRLLLILPVLLLSLPLSAQRVHRLIREREVGAALAELSSDAMQGRRPLTPGIERAADYIAASFAAAGLEPLAEGGGYLQRFHMLSATVTSASLELDGRVLGREDFMAFPVTERLEWQGAGARLVRLGRQGNPVQEFLALLREPGDKLVVADTSLRSAMGRLRGFRGQRMEGSGSVVLAFHPSLPTSYRMQAAATLSRSAYANVVGKISGSERADEAVLFSAHYDHLGVGRAVAGDSIYNGANDDASGTVAVMSLARFYKRGPRPARTLIFAAFTAEESGGHGSQYFSRRFDPDRVVAMFNIEMIGTESKWGRNSAYITGYEKSDFGPLLQEALSGTGFTFHPDPYPAQNLFYRSDNATLARLGVPAHTISTSKMDAEPYYHTVDDEFGTLDISNMTAVIRSIALSARGIVSGERTPSRVK